MKAVFAVNAHEYTAAHRLPLLHAARGRGWQVIAIAPEASPALTRLENEGFPVEPLALSRRGIGPWDEVRAIRSLERLYRHLRPDLVHHATIKPVLYGTIAARRSGVPAVVNAITGLGYIYTANGLRSWALRRVVNPLYRFALRHPNQRIVFQNSDDWSVLKSIGAVHDSECVLIPGSGVDVEYFKAVPESKEVPLVVLPGRMLRNKGVFEFVEAARILKAQGTNARFALVGGLDPDNPSAIAEEVIKSWVNGGVVEWWGQVADMRSVYRDAHVVVLPSHREGMPKALLEASASCRPTIATDVPGCRDAVVDGVTGYLVPPDSPRALSERILRLVHSPEQRLSMGRSGRERAVECFSKKRIVTDTLAVYDELLAERRNH